MLADDLVATIGMACESLIERYAQTPRKKGTKTTPDEYRTPEEVQRFVDGLLLVTA